MAYKYTYISNDEIKELKKKYLKNKTIWTEANWIKLANDEEFKKKCKLVDCIYTNFQLYMIFEDENGNKLLFKDSDPEMKIVLTKYNKDKILYIEKASKDKKYTSYKIKVRDYYKLRKIYERLLSSETLKLSMILPEYSDDENFYSKLMKLSQKFERFDIFNDFKLEMQVHQYFDKVKYKVSYYDIEVLSAKEFPKQYEAKYPIITIALYNDWENTIYFFYLDNNKIKFNKEKLIENIKSDNKLKNINIKIIKAKTEKDLLLAFFKNIKNSHILTGWNSINFDTMYILNRSIRLGLLGKFIKYFGLFDKSVNNSEDFILTTNIVQIDYKHLLKSYEHSASNLPSYTLEYVAKKFLKDSDNVNDGKVKIDSIYDAYFNNLEYLAYYNIKDTYLVYLLEKRFKLIELLSFLKRVVGGFSLNNYSTNAIIESYLTKIAKDKNLIISSIKKAKTNNIKLFKAYAKVNELDNILNDLEKIIENKKSEVLDKYSELNEILLQSHKFIEKEHVPWLYSPKVYPGGHVKKPKTGLHWYIADNDAESLYPTTTLAIKASPDTLDYIIPENISLKWIFEREYLQEDIEKDFLIYDVKNNTFIKIKKENAYKILEKLSKKYVFTALGTLFRKELGIIPALMEEAIKLRKEHKNKMKEILNTEGINEKYYYHNNMQSVYKLIANSLYGYTGYQKGRLFANIIASSITITAQFITKYTSYNLNLFLEKNKEIIKSKFSKHKIEV